MAILPYKTAVTSPAVSKDMTVLSTVKAELGVTGTTHDDFINALIQQASGKAVELAGREFAKETMTESFRVDRCDHLLQLSRRPISSVTSIVEDDEALTGSDYEIIGSTGWLQRIDSDGDPTSWEAGKTVVVYIAGWTMLTELPHALERIVIDEVKRKWFSRERDPQLKSEAVPGVVQLGYWVPGETPSKDPMLSALEAAGFCESIGI